VHKHKEQKHKKTRNRITKDEEDKRG